MRRMKRAWRRCGRWLGSWLVFCGLLLLVACKPAVEVSEGVQLVVQPATLDPTSTFEARFDAAMVSADALGTPAESPLDLSPPLPGTFTWLSQRSGVFRPSAPPALGTEYRIRLRPGLRQADGQPSRARLIRLLRTPGLQVIDPLEWAPRWGGAHPMTDVRLTFNAAVRAEDAARHIRYRSRDAGEVRAEVRQVRLEEFAGYPGVPWALTMPGQLLTWQQRFEMLSSATNRPPSGLPLDGTNTLESPVAHCIEAKPARPLPVGHGWELVVEAGLGSPETPARLPSPVVIPLGDVLAFAATNVAADSGLRSGRKILISFSKALAPDVTSTNVLDWVSISPTPTNLEASVHTDLVRLWGAFELHRTYTVEVRPGLRATEPQVTETLFTGQVSFEPLPPRLYWPGLSVEQMAAGRREFPLLAVNAGRVEVKAKLLDASVLIHALRGYRSYWDPERPRGWLEPYRRLDYNLVPGRTVFQRVFDLSNTLDQARTLELPWDDVLGRGRKGAVFLQAETASPSPEDLRGGTGGEYPLPPLPSPSALSPTAPAPSPRVGAQAVVQVTDLGLLWKQAPGETLAYAFSHRTGLGLPGTEVRWVTDENEVLSSGRTDASGLLRLPTVSTGAWFVVEQETDLVGIEAGSGHLSRYWHGLDWDDLDDDRAKRPRVLLYSDRPVYRPGDTMHIEAVVRERRGGHLRYPTQPSTRLRCYNARGQQFLDTNLTLNAVGAVEHALELPPVSQGTYRAQVSIGDAEFDHYFQVRDYRPNAFELKLDHRPEYGPGEKPEVGVKAKYLFGAPVSKGKIDWILGVDSEPFVPTGYDAFEFCGWAYGTQGPEPPGRFSLTGQGAYSSATNVTIAPAFAAGQPAEAAAGPGVSQGGGLRGPGTCRLLVELTDLNQQTLAESAEFTVHSSEFYLGFKQAAAGLVAGTNLPVELVAVRRDGQPWPDPVRAKVRLRRIEWRTVRVESAGNVVGFRSEADPVLVGEKELPTRALVLRDDQWEVAPDAGPPDSFPIEQAGEYVLEAQARDPAGREVLTTVVFNVAGKEQLAWNYRNEVELELVRDAELYEVGTVARLLAKTPFAGRALVTVEREAVLRAWVTNLAGNAPAIDVPLLPGDAPNVFVSVTLLRGAADSPREIPVPEYRLGYCRLDVAEPDTQLKVAIKTDAEMYRPGAPVRAAIEVRASDAHPAAGAAVTVYAVDEGVLSLTGYDMPDPHAFFYNGEPLAVQTGLSLPSLLPEEPAEHWYQNKGYIIGGGGQEQVRQDFRACAFWAAGLTTDARGQVEVQFTAPDNLTRYRLMAVVHAGETRFGSAATRFGIDKPLMIEPALPPIARVGDRLRARATVFNRTDRSGAVDVTLRLDAHGAIEGTPASSVAAQTTWTNRIALSPHSAAAVDAPVRFTEVGSAVWEWAARWATPTPGDDDRDAVKTSVQVGYPTPLLREVHVSRVPSGESNRIADVNPQLLEGAGWMTVRVAHTRLAGLSEAAERLLHYPYGCLEQTSSSLLPWVIALDTNTVWLRGTNRLADVHRAIRAGMHRLAAMQKSEGGLTYWPGGPTPMLWGSAYAGVILGVAQRNGFTPVGLDPDALARYLEAGLRDAASAAPGPDLEDRCLAAFALALLGKPPAAYLETLFDRRAALTPAAQALLAVATIESGGATNRVAELLRTLAPAAHAPHPFACPASEAAIRLLAWTRLRPAAPEVDRLVVELTQTMRDGHWGSTQGNAWALYALAEYARRVESGAGPATGRLVAGDIEERFELTPSAPVFEWRQRWDTNPPVVLPTLFASGARPLYIETAIEARPRVWSQPPQDRGYALQRRYAVLDDESRPRDTTVFHVGDRVLVTLEFEARDSAAYLVLDDPIPCVFEPVNPEFRSQETRGAATVAPEWVSSHRELRADRAVFFCDRLRAGRYTIQYLARVRATGRVTAPAAKIEEMYRPERLGLTGTQEILVE